MSPNRGTDQGSGLSAVSLIQMSVSGSSLCYFWSDDHHTVRIRRVVFEVVVVVFFCNIEVLEW